MTYGYNAATPGHTGGAGTTGLSSVNPVAQGRLLTSTEVAYELGLSRRTIIRYVRAGWITAELVTPGGQHRFDLETVKRQLRDLQDRRGP